MSALFDARVDDLFDLLANAPNGMRLPDISEALELTKDETTRTIRALRMAFSNDTVNLVCEPNGQGEYWTYQLVGRPEDQRSWVAWRMLNVETQLETIKAVTDSAIVASDGRTLEGRKARYINMNIRHLLEQLELMTGSGDVQTLF